MADFRNYEGASWALTDEQKEFFQEMEKELDEAITVICGRSQRMDREENIEGVVFIDYSTNSESPTPRRVDAISRRNSTMVKLENGYLLKPDDRREYIWDFNGFPLAEIRHKTLWGLTPLQNFATKDLMKEFWADAIRQSANEKFFKEKEEAKQKKVRDAFLETMKVANKGEVEAEKRKLDEQGSRLAQLNQDMFAVQTELFRTEQRLEIAQKLSEGNEQLYEEEIRSLMKHRQIKRIDYDTGNGVLEVFTSPLYIYSPNRQERSLLGEFLIKVATKSNNSITLHNLTNQRSHKMHPHVESNGSACWGAIGPQIAKLAASAKIEGMADMCIRYLESYNVQDGNAQYARYWFTTKDTQKKRSDFSDQWMTEDEYKEALDQKKELAKKDKVVAVGDKVAVKEEANTKTTNKTLQETSK